MTSRGGVARGGVTRSMRRQLSHQTREVGRAHDARLGRQAPRRRGGGGGVIVHWRAGGEWVTCDRMPSLYLQDFFFWFADSFSVGNISRYFQ